MLIHKNPFSLHQLDSSWYLGPGTKIQTTGVYNSVETVKEATSNKLKGNKMLGHTERRLNNGILLQSAMMNFFSRTMENAEKLISSEKRKTIEDKG